MVLNWRQLKAFLNQIIIRDDDDCWEWQGRLTEDGYGTMSIKDVASLAHRVAWIIHTGKRIPTGKYVLHTCDYPACVNPKHLYIGDQKKNMEDKVARGRAKSKAGASNGNSILTDDQVLEIKRMRASGVKRRKVADAFGVSLATIDRIAYGLSWRHLQDSTKEGEGSK